MNHDYDLFEKFPDGSSLWRDSIPGLEKTRIRLDELGQTSENQFYAINMATGEVLVFDPKSVAREFPASSMRECRSKNQAAHTQIR